MKNKDEIRETLVVYLLALIASGALPVLVLLLGLFCIMCFLLFGG